MISHVGTIAFGTLVALWTAAAVLRFVDMYDRWSPFQRWRRLDYFHLVPTGAYFSPEPPAHRVVLVVRDVFDDGTATNWTEPVASPRRRPSHAIWNPAKLCRRAQAEACRDLLQTFEVLQGATGELPPSFLFSEAYLHLLRYVSGLARNRPFAATQFAVLEIDIMTDSVTRYVTSALHESAKRGSPA